MRLDNTCMLLTSLLVIALFTLTVYKLQAPVIDAQALSAPAGRDFVNVWSVARLALNGQGDILYDFTSYHAAQETLFGHRFSDHCYSYPPHFTLFTLPFGFFSYDIAFYIWTLGTFGLLVWSLRGYVKPDWPLWIICLAVFLAPASIINILTGQNGFLSAALFIGGLRLLEKKPLWAGIMFGLLTFKPHLGLLIPIALIAGGYWRVILSASAMTLVLIFLSTWAFGYERWLEYVTIAAPLQKDILEQGEGIFVVMMPTALSAARILGVDLSSGYAVNLFMGLCAAWIVYWSWRHVENSGIRHAVLLASAVIATPYAFTYDMTLTTMAAVILLPYLKNNWEKAAALGIGIAPAAIIGLNLVGAPLGPVLLGIFGISAWCVARRHALEGEPVR